MKKIIVVVHNVRSLHNVGSIFRTADAAGAEKIYLCGITPSPKDQFGKIRPQFAKVSLGAEKYIEWDDSARSPQAIKKLFEKLKKDGYKIFAIEQSKKSIPYYKVKLSAMTRHSGRGKKENRAALVLGNEVRGLPPPILKAADKILEIPMRGKIIRQAGHPRHVGRGKESLNVSVSFGIVIFRFAYPG